MWKSPLSNCEPTLTQTLIVKMSCELQSGPAEVQHRCLRMQFFLSSLVKMATAFVLSSFRGRLHFGDGWACACVFFFPLLT